MKKIGLLGSGAVGKVLAEGFLKHGYHVMLGSREPAKLAAWQAAAGSRPAVGTFADAARFGEVVVLAVKGTAAEEVVRLVGPDILSGKTVIDTTNPIADAPPVNGVLRFFTTLDESLMERLQRLAPAVRFVKAFSSVGNALMVNSAAKADVTGILDQFGWGSEDMGGVEAARAIEPLCMLWCIPGFRQNRWRHALKLLE